MYDFMVFGYYAAAIGNAFFPSGSPFLSLMLSLMTFGAGFLMRPLGAIVLGAYTDRHGRRAGLLLLTGLLAATGLTNRQIAQELFVTAATVDTHLRHVFQKLDVKARGALATALSG